jgi:phosphatidylglycerophosphate synthase
VLDGVDGRVARMIKGQSKFGAELDSLADFVNFGVAPGLMLYFWQAHELNNGGWIAAMVFAIAGGLRLARFNARSTIRTSLPLRRITSPACRRRPAPSLRCCRSTCRFSASRSRRPC